MRPYLTIAISVSLSVLSAFSVNALYKEDQVLSAQMENSSIKNAESLQKTSSALVRPAIPKDLGVIQTQKAAKKGVANANVLNKTANDLPTFNQIVKDVQQSVVLIKVQKSNSGSEPDPFQEFYKKFGPKGIPKGPDNKDDEDGDAPIMGGLGSGFFINKNGNLLTNAHVVKDAQKIIVRTFDKKEHQATLVGLDERTDIALLKIETDKYPAVSIGDISATEVGDWVLAIGNPFGFEASATVGVVSAKERSLPDENYLPFLQTDAAINPGNSGGPLFNTTGEVLGINTQIYSRSGGYMGISFAIPIDYALKIAQKLQTDGRFVHGRIGASIQDLTPDLAKALGAPDLTGVVILSVEKDSPADKAGIKSGDALLRFNAQRLEDLSSFVRAVAQTEPGSQITLDVLRSKKVMEVGVTVGAAPVKSKEAEKENSTKSTKKEEFKKNIEVLGLKLEVLTDKELLDGVSNYSNVLKIISADERAQKAGVLEGDLILVIDGQDIASSSAFEEKVNAAPTGASFSLLIKRGEDVRFVVLQKVK